MQDFIKYLYSENVIRDLKQIYKVNINKSNQNLLLDRLIENLNSLNFSKPTTKNKKFSNLEDLDLDIISKLYAKTRKHDEKRILGEFYTPISVVKYILDAVGFSKNNEIENRKLVDISCGSGSFIVQAVIRTIEYWKEKLNITKLSELSVNEAKSIIENIQTNIIGVDINPVAVILCQINIQLVLFNIFNLIRKSEKNYTFPKFKIFNKSALELSITEEYDFVVGNPPYLFIRDIPQNQRNMIDKKNLETNVGQYDYYQIFMELGIKLLKNHGILGYIVPDSLLALSNRKVIRKYIYENVKIKELYHIGPKFKEPIVSNTIVILQKENNIIEREANQILIKIAMPEEIKSKLVGQNNIKEWNYDFLIHLSREDVLILRYLNAVFPKLGHLMNQNLYEISLSRGVELGKEGEIIYCNRCDKFLPLPKEKLICPLCDTKLSKNLVENIIYSRINSSKKKDFLPYIYSIERYLIKEFRYIDISKKGINYKDLEIYKDRIIIRQMSQNAWICAAYDKGLSLTSQSFYNLKIRAAPVLEFNNYYLLGILNSSLLSYFFIKSFGSYKKLFPRILIEKIKNLPIKVPKSEEEKQKAKKIIEIAKLMLEDGKILKPYLKTIDSLVFELYDITKSNQNYIQNYMNNF
ncbi:MAG: N-6 DNA methylase [Promethearchaeota archaeon]|nr:MAG: N-6 DNA methylase [Candidatus Lokiarchaeota archaeon]